ncbi:MAG: hypothetical protein A3I77_00945 [Gammaproteobacteria bacterium RIFCSPLOWO2_02_FULL_42_14]|nr:MAG: hypothetical protein A3I77_00945 [Gammaproteobacteria bacterium RIFCSPLOWO2_02_FULL_42_14]OGT85313.1 MAG: hypothetical protein A3G86_05580 [Gammaproteobacteria bacterium RIFCSPLOWO2_12_FULL_42_18]
MRSVESAEQQALQIKPLWFLLSVNDALGETLTFLDIRTLIALRLAFQLPESFLQIQIPLLQEKIPLAYSAVIRQLIFYKPQSKNELAIHKRFVFTEQNIDSNLEAMDLFNALESDTLDFFQKLKLMIDNTRSLFSGIPKKLEEEIIHFVNKGIEILWTDESSVDALLSILINCTQNTDAINKHWDQFKWNISTGDGGQEREAKFLGVLARFALLLKDNTKINECIKLTFHFLEYTAQSRWEPRGTLLTWEPEKALLSCFIKLLIAVQNEEQIDNYWDLYVKNPYPDYQTVYFLTQLSLALNDTRKMKIGLEYLNGIMKSASSSDIREEGWIAFRKISLALQDTSIIRVYQGLAAEKLLDEKNYSFYGDYREIWNCFTELTIALNDCPNQINTLFEKLRGSSDKASPVVINQQIISLSKLVLSTKNIDMMRSCFQLIVDISDIWPNFLLIYEPWSMKFATQFMLALKDAKEKTTCWNFYEEKFRRALIKDPNRRLPAMEHFIQFVLSINDIFRMMRCWDIINGVIGEYETPKDFLNAWPPYMGESSYPQAVKSLTRLAYAMQDTKKLHLLFLAHLSFDPENITSALPVLTIYPSLALSGRHCYPVKSKEVIVSAINLMNTLSEYFIPQFTVDFDAIDQQSTPILTSLNDFFHRRFHPSKWVCENEPHFYNALREKFNLIILQDYNDRPKAMLSRFASLFSARRSTFSERVLNDSGIKIRLLLHEAFGEAVFSENAIHDTELFRRELNKHVENILTLSSAVVNKRK